MGEYIDREALICNIKNEIEQQRKMGNVFAATAFAHIKGVVDKLPAADVVEVRHGEWIKITYYPMGHKCSECGYIKRYKKPYCEICGAKMDGKGEG